MACNGEKQGEKGMGNNSYSDFNERIWYGAPVHMEEKCLVGG